MGQEQKYSPRNFASGNWSTRRPESRPTVRENIERQNIDWAWISTAVFCVLVRTAGWPRLDPQGAPPLSAEVNICREIFYNARSPHTQLRSWLSLEQSVSFFQRCVKRENYVFMQTAWSAHRTEETMHIAQSSLKSHSVASMEDGDREYDQNINKGQGCMRRYDWARAKPITTVDLKRRDCYPGRLLLAAMVVHRENQKDAMERDGVASLQKNAMERDGPPQQKQQNASRPPAHCFADCFLACGGMICGTPSSGTSQPPPVKRDENNDVSATQARPQRTQPSKDARPEEVGSRCTGCGTCDPSVVDGFRCDPKSPAMLLCGMNLLRWERLKPSSGDNDIETKDEQLCFFCILARFARELAMTNKLGDDKRQDEEALVEMEARREFLRKEDSRSNVRDAHRLTEEERAVLACFEEERVGTAVNTKMQEEFGGVSTAFASPPLLSMASSEKQQERIAANGLHLSQDAQAKARKPGWGDRHPTSVDTATTCMGLFLTLVNRSKNQDEPCDFDEALQRAKVEVATRDELRLTEEVKDNAVLAAALKKADDYVVLVREEAKNWSALNIYRLDTKNAVASGMDVVKKTIADWEEHTKHEIESPRTRAQADQSLHPLLAGSRLAQLELQYGLPDVFGPPDESRLVDGVLPRAAVCGLAEFFDQCNANHVTALLRHGIPALRTELLECHRRRQRSAAGSEHP